MAAVSAVTFEERVASPRHYRERGCLSLRAYHVLILSDTRLILHGQRGRNAP